MNINTSLIAMAVAVLMASGLVITLAAGSLFSGGFHFLFARPKFRPLRKSKGSSETSFAFSLTWNSAREPVKFDVIKIRLFNPFGSPTQVQVAAPFGPKDRDFALEVEFGSGLNDLLNAQGMEGAMVEVEVSSEREGISQFFKFKGQKFIELMDNATVTVEDFEQKNTKVNQAPVFHTTERSFISGPLPVGDKQLALPTNPVFADQFVTAGGAAGGAAGGGDAVAQENFNVAKVWIEPGCIVCDACEAIYPEVFEVLADTCIVRPDYPKDNGLLVEEAAEACPVEVIKFDKAN